MFGTEIYGAATDSCIAVHEVDSRLALQHISSDSGAQRLSNVLISSCCVRRITFVFARMFFSSRAASTPFRTGILMSMMRRQVCVVSTERSVFLSVRGLADNQNLVFPAMPLAPGGPGNDASASKTRVGIVSNAD